MSKSVFSLGLVALALGLGAQPALAQMGGAPRATPVVVYEAQVAPYADRIEALGTLRANETVELTAPVADTITAINFEDGGRVEEGFTLVEMTSAEERALLAEAQSTYEESRSQFERARDLVERGSATRSALDERRRDYETAQARLRATQSRLQDRLIIAPFAGVLGLRNVSVGSYVSPGQVITTLHDDSVMKLDFAVPEVYFASVDVGQVIEATARALPGEIFTGEVSSIDAAIDPVTRAIQVRALIPNEDRRLRPGMLMRVELIRAPRDTIMVPESAVIVDGGQSYAWIVGEDGETADRRAVRTGSRDVGRVEILSGVSAGDRVITRGASNLRPGAPVSVRAIETGDESLIDLLSQTEE